MASLAAFNPFGRFKADVESSRTHFNVLDLEGQVLGFEANKSSKMSCPRLEDSTFFDCLKMDHGHDLLSTLPWKTAETSQKKCRRPFGEHLIFHGKSMSPRVKIFFLGEHLSLVSLASRGFVLEKSVLGLGFFFATLALASKVMPSTPPLI